MDTIGSRIKSLLKKNKISQKQLSEETGIHLNTLGHIIRGDTDPGVSKINLIASALNTDINWLITGKSTQEIYSEQQSKEINFLIAEKGPKWQKEENVTLVKKLLMLNQDHRDKINEIIDGYLKIEENEK